MKKSNIAFYLFSFLAAVIVTYILMIRQDGATQQQALINSLAGGVGMVLGLLIYKRIGKKGNDNPPPLD